MDLLSRELNGAPNIVGTMVASLSETTRDLHSGTAAAQGILSMESLTDVQRLDIGRTQEGIVLAIESIRNTLGIDGSFTQAQKDAAAQAGLIASNWRGFQTLKLRDPAPRNAPQGSVVTVESYTTGDVVSERSYAMEAYNEQDNRSAVAYAITYNLQSSRQDDFGESLFPTITIPADQAGVTITTNLLHVLDNVDRNVSGAAYDLKRKNLLRAVADPNVLRKEQTRAVPVHRVQSQANFVATGTLAVRNVDIDGEVIPTSALLFNRQVDLLGVSQSDSLIAAGVQNQTDTLDPTVELTAFYVQIGNDKIRNVTSNLPYANFVPNAQGDYKLLTLNFETNSLLLNKDTRNVDGTALTGALAQIAADDLIVRVRSVLTGSVRTDTGNITVYGNTYQVYSITDAATGDNVPLADVSVTALVAAIDGRTFLGYDPLAYRSNANRRQQGQFVNVSKQFQRYMVPLRSPITARHPAHIDASIDASDVQALITATRVRLNNEAVTAVLSSLDVLSSFVDVRDNVNEAPDVLGVGRFFLRPTLISRQFDAAAAVDSLKSHERAQDIQAALVNHLRDIAFLLHRNSEFKAASDAIYGGVGPVPTVIIATEPYLARYINVSGDLRTLGGEFDVRVVSTLDYRFRGKIVVAFGLFDSERNSAINPLNNGNLLWAPELVLTANIGRGGQYSRETLVQPRYRFIQNSPVLGVLEVSNIPNVLNKLPLFMNDVTVP